MPRQIFLQSIMLLAIKNISDKVFLKETLKYVTKNQWFWAFKLALQLCVKSVFLIQECY